MLSSSASRWVWLCGVGALAVIALATLAPAEWVVLRTGVHWAVDHFLGYFTVTALVCVAWRRPFLVATSLMFVAGFLEALQGLTLDRTPNLLSALSGAGGVLTAALLASILLRRSSLSAAGVEHESGKP
jgi:hypothetical protein